MGNSPNVDQVHQSITADLLKYLRTLEDGIYAYRHAIEIGVLSPDREKEAEVCSRLCAAVLYEVYQTLRFTLGVQCGTEELPHSTRTGVGGYCGICGFDTTTDLEPPSDEIAL